MVIVLKLRMLYPTTREGGGGLIWMTVKVFNDRPKFWKAGARTPIYPDAESSCPHQHRTKKGGGQRWE